MVNTTGAIAESVSFKGRMMTLTVIEIGTADVERIGAEVARQVERAREFFAGMPVLLSLPGPLPDLVRVRDLLLAQDLRAVGVLDATDATADAAAEAGLGVIASPGGRETRGPEASESGVRSEAKQPDSPAATAARIVTKPVRSGQQIYARGGDLVIMTSVSEGAEVLADGHIHIYGTLRGRALAGARGDTQARIFCRRFEPDLVAIAGCYKVADAIDERVWSKAVGIRLDDDNLTIELQE